MSKPLPPLEFKTTRTGLQIGCCHVRQRSRHSFTQSEEWLQRVLLPQQPTPRIERIAGVVLALVAIAIAWALIGGR
jgi:hypothetical protein